MISCGLRSFWSCPSLFTPPQSRVIADKLEKHHFRPGLRITESVGLEGTTDIHLVQPPFSNRVTPQGTGLFPDGSGVSPVRGRLHTLSGQSVPMLGYSPEKKFFLTFRWDFLGISFCFLSYCLSPPSRACLHPLTPSFHTLTGTYKSSLLSAK